MTTRAVYSYATGDMEYSDLLASVQEVSDEQAESMKQVSDLAKDEALVDAIRQNIRNGVNTKMKLIKAVSPQTGVSNRIVAAVIDKYSGTDAAKHFWTFSVGNRGAQIFTLLAPSGDDSKSTLNQGVF